jgi:hypothetical protein
MILTFEVLFLQHQIQSTAISRATPAKSGPLIHGDLEMWHLISLNKIRSVLLIHSEKFTIVLHNSPPQLDLPK